MRFLLESLLSSYWAVQDFFHISLRDSNRFYSNCSFYCLKTVKSFSAKTKTSHEAYSHDINNPLLFEISEDDHPYSLSQMLTFNSPIANARLVTLAPDLRPERRFAPLARGLLIPLPSTKSYWTAWKFFLFCSRISQPTTHFNTSLKNT